MSTEMLPGEENAKSDVLSGAYEKYYQIKPGDKVFDLGAHVGYFTRLAANKVGPLGTVFAFEPHPTNFKRLRLVYEDNTTSICLLPFAALEMDCRTELWNNPGNSGGHSLFKCNQHDMPIAVTAVNISTWVAALEPDFVKIDTEGSEHIILNAILRTGKRPHIAFETHSHKLYYSCKELLESNDYEVNPKTSHVGVCYGTPQ